MGQVPKGLTEAKVHCAGSAALDVPEAVIIFVLEEQNQLDISRPLTQNTQLVP